MNPLSTHDLTHSENHKATRLVKVLLQGCQKGAPSSSVPPSLNIQASLLMVRLSAALGIRTVAGLGAELSQPMSFG